VKEVMSSEQLFARKTDSKKHLGLPKSVSSEQAYLQFQDGFWYTPE